MSSDIDTSRDHSLETVRLDLIEALSRAARAPGDPLRTPVIASVDANGAPQARVMVLRAFDPQSMRLRLFTDSRSPKVRQLQTKADIQAVFYDGGQKLHFRVSGHAKLHTRSQMTHELWDQLPEFGRGDYLSRLPPGALINDPTEGWHQDDAFGSEHFAVLDITIREVDWLKLSASGHKRAQLIWRDGQCEGRWVTP